MSDDQHHGPRTTRRGLITAGAALLASACTSTGPRSTAAGSQGDVEAQAGPAADEPFFGPHQGGILTPAQNHTYFAAFDLTTGDRQAVINLLRGWTEAAARMSSHQTAAPLGEDLEAPGADTGDALGLAGSRLTVTFGFGPGLFLKDGKDRYGLAAGRPEALAELPKFPGDQLVEARCGGDLSIQACANDAQVAFHAVRQLARIADGSAEIRWVQSGFIGGFADTPRNLMGFKDGTGNPPVTDAALMDQHIWVGSEGPAWLQGGSYVVARRSRIALEHWDRMNVAFQEQTFGRKKYSGAPLGGVQEQSPLQLDLNDAAGNPVIPENAHVRLAHHTTNDGARILRRSYSYNDGVNITAERWPPWRQGMEYDAGLLFVCYQRDPRTGFTKIFEGMSKFDMLNQFVTNNGSALFACPRGVAQGEYIGQGLFAV